MKEFERKNQTGLIPRSQLGQVTQRIVELERDAKTIKEVEAAMRKQIIKAFQTYGITKWDIDGATIRLIVEEDKIKDEFDFKTFAKENPDLVKKYTKQTWKPGKEPYIRINLEANDEN